ncbi:response regulator [Thiorhodococcus mannitoliphagus]|uniref:Response regulator n=1 Tax=Thiorhodococcus mannitoliphagus TaxID=329406 RepID=A0A6P1E3L5_9GAMM|nr:response regulator [Thiorhodococcus mannitoliphagus]NEX22275.1 response regulator [Thiorhodococcus mannitoliphagus]
MRRFFRKSSSPSANKPSAAESKGAIILVVDDSPTETRIFTSTLMKAGYEVETATNGEEAVEVARSIKPDLILMDVIMPVLNGYQATRLIRKDPDIADTPIIMVTTKDMQTDRTWGIRQGATDYMVKPVDRQRLLERIAELLDGDADA